MMQIGEIYVTHAGKCVIRFSLGAFTEQDSFGPRFMNNLGYPLAGANPHDAVVSNISPTTFADDQKVIIHCAWQAKRVEGKFCAPQPGASLQSLILHNHSSYSPSEMAFF